MKTKKWTVINLILLVCVAALAAGCVYRVVETQKDNSTGEILSYRAYADKYTYRNTKGVGGVSGIGDPHVFWDDASQKWYMVGTTGGSSIKIFSSDDLTGWDKGQEIIYLKDVPWASQITQGLWGAEIHKVNGKYHLYFSSWGMDENGQETSPRIGVATCDTVNGLYVSKDEPLFDFGYSAIDNHLFTDDDGTRYLLYVRDATDNVVNDKRESHIYVVKLQADALSADPDFEPVCLITPEYEWERLSPDPVWSWTEGCWLQKMENGKYYLFYSANKFSTWDYCINYAVSDSITGPYVKNPEPLMKTYAEQLAGPGNNSFFRSKDGKELFTAYHMLTTPASPSGNRYLNIDRIGLRKDGTVYVDAATITDQPLPSGEKAGHTLLSDEAKITADTAAGYQTSAVNDGEIAVTRQYENNEWCSANGADKASIRFEWDQEVEINSIFIYNSIVPEHASASVDIRFSNGVTLEKIALGTFGGEAGIVEANGIRAKWFEITVAEQTPGQTEFALSEVMAFGSR